MKKFIDGRLVVKRGDITEMESEAIVNAANSGLLGGGGVDGAVHRKGGPQISAECKEIRRHRYPDGLPTGKAVITSGGNLRASHVIHTVGPVWHGGKNNEKEELGDAYRNSLRLATETGINSISFPAISTGVYGFPKELAGPIAYKTIKEYLEKNSLPRKVCLVFFSQDDYDTFLNAIMTELND